MHPDEAQQVERKITFSAEGEGAAVIGTGNGNPSSHEAYGADNRNIFNGLALVIVRKGKSGTVVRAKAWEL